MPDTDTNPVGADSGIVSADVDPSTHIDNPSNWEFTDSSDDEQTEGDEEQRIEGEADEADEQSEETAKSEQDEDGEAEPEDSDEEQPEGDDEADEPATFTLSDGREVSEQELIAGNMREADYRRKTQAVAETRRTLDAQSQRLQAQVDALAEYVSQRLPPEPDLNLAYTDPAAFNAQKAIYDQSLSHVQQLLSMVDEPKKVAEELTSEAHMEMVQEENSRLAMAYPQTTTENGRKEFFKAAFEGGRHFGFPEEEMKSVTDHRMIAMARYAAIGMAAEKAKATAKRKVAAVSKPAPSKSRKAPGNRDAMKKLGQTGSIHDAVNVDWA